MKRILFALGMALGLEALASDGLAQQDSAKQSKEVVQNYQKLLRANEYVVPEKVFAIYRKLLQEDDTLDGLYLYRRAHHFDGNISFVDNLRGLHCSEREVAFYDSLLNSGGKKIVISQSTVHNDSFRTTLEHERMHRSIQESSAQDYLHLKRAAKEIIYLTLPLEDAVERKDKYLFDDKETALARKKGLEDIPFLVQNPVYTDKSVTAAHEDWEEFYPYLAGGRYVERVERFLQKQYPPAYAIFSRMREEARVK